MSGRPNIPAFSIQKATKKQAKLRIALSGPSGSGKTYSLLAIGTNLGERVCLIDTERSSAALYSDIFNFDTLVLESFEPQTYTAAFNHIEGQGYDVIIIDSLSHAWAGKGGALEQVSKAAERSQSGNKFTAWDKITPVQNELVDTMLGCTAHLLVSLRSKTEWVLEQNEKGKTTPRKIGMAPVQRDGIEYEFTVFGEMNLEHNMFVTKSRCSVIDQKDFAFPGKELAEILRNWLDSGEKVAPVVVPPIVKPIEGKVHALPQPAEKPPEKAPEKIELAEFTGERPDEKASAQERGDLMETLKQFDIPAQTVANFIKAQWGINPPMITRKQMFQTLSHFTPSA